VREFVETAFSSVGLDYKKYVVIDPQFFRPAEQVQLCGNPGKIAGRLGWERTRNLREIIAEIVASEMALSGPGNK